MQTDELKVVCGYNPSQNSETALIFRQFRQQSKVVGVLGECLEGK